MANNCSNYIQITGENLSVVKDLFPEGETLTFDKFIEILKLDKTTSIDMGTKWFDLSYVSEIEDTFFIINGFSAWAPPLVFFEILSEMYNLKITIDYEEPGNDFGGQCVVNNGVVEFDHELSYFGYQLEYGSGFDYILEDISSREYESMEDFWDDFADDEDFVSRLTEEDLMEIKNTINENKRLS
jgi:hypothetical protein